MIVRKTMSDLFKYLKNSSNLITGHINPDGDALGSALAFKLILDSKGVESDVSFDMKGNVPSNLNHLPIDLILDSPKKNYENVYVFDCGNSERLGDLEEIALNSTRVIVVDHHINPSFGDIQVIDSNAASTTQVLFREILSAKIDIDKNIANCLMTGLITDTGRFQYSNTDNEVFEIASKLMLSGAELTSISDNIYGSIPLNAIKLQSEVLNRIELYEDEELVVSYVLQEDYQTAIDTTLKILERKTDDFDSNNNLGSYYLKVEEFKKALFYIEKAKQQPEKVNDDQSNDYFLSLIHISEPTRLLSIGYGGVCG